MFDILFVFKRCLTGKSKKQKFICTKTQPTKLEKFRRCQYYVFFVQTSIENIKKQTYFVFLISYKLLDYFLQSSQIWFIISNSSSSFFLYKSRIIWFVVSWINPNPKKLQRLNYFHPLYLSKGSFVYLKDILSFCVSDVICHILISSQ